MGVVSDFVAMVWNWLFSSPPATDTFSAEVDRYVKHYENVRGENENSEWDRTVLSSAFTFEEFVKYTYSQRNKWEFEETTRSCFEVVVFAKNHPLIPTRVENANQMKLDEMKKIYRECKPKHTASLEDWVAVSNEAAFRKVAQQCTNGEEITSVFIQNYYKNEWWKHVDTKTRQKLNEAYFKEKVQALWKNILSPPTADKSRIKENYAADKS